ncbi:tetratricopeptide repeat protein 12 [Echinococcus multilocularis]|uniref:Tetratricopeptide repeat protein 12 n=1 Tax=Echinococcus multilocularis TaxID=6211 RepID=A0A068Y627_ECHMU|nr:tetratricopeptide repeat protein 12 [Echinococcus multilocularis]
MELNKLTNEDCEKLANVEEMSEIISRLSCSDADVSAKAIEEADKLLKKINTTRSGSRINKTFINKSLDSGSATQHTGVNANGSGPEQMSVEAFKAQVAADAAERSRRRARCRARAEEFKKQANEFFKVGDMENAIKIYTKAIDACRDWAVLYNNRALAYLRAGRPELALVDCDLALRLLPAEPKTTPTDIGEDADAARDTNQQAAKACLRRGKALLVLRRPRDALSAYVDARAFDVFAHHPATGVMPDTDSDVWPPFLREGVAQVKAAIAADSLDSQSSIQLSLFNDCETLLLEATEERFLRLITEAAVFGRKMCQYTLTLRQMAALLSAANVAPNIPPTTSGSESEEEEAAEKTEVVTSPNGDQAAPESGSHYRKRKKGRDSGKAASASASPRDGDANEAASDEVATLAKLQSYFRVRNGFTVLESQMKRFDASGVVKLFCRREGTVTKAPPSDQCVEDILAILDHLLSLITVCYQLARDCGENQRLLVETMPQLFSTLLVDCLKVSPSCARLPISSTVAPETAARHELQLHHLLGLLQCSACDLIALMSCEASGREGLLTYPGPAVLLSALATCLSDALGLPCATPVSELSFCRSLKAQTALAQQRSSADCFATQTVAATAKILENITKSPRFLTVVRSSDCFTSLQNVVEAAIAPSPSNSNSTATTSAPVTCLSVLLDSLSAASADPVLRRTMISKPNFVVNLANCAIRHVPLMMDESHTALVGSLCRLLHNFLSGELRMKLSQQEMEALLTLVGDILDTPSHSSPLISVSIALLGRFMPLCTADLVEKWSHSGRDAPELPNKKHVSSVPRLKERIKLLISIVCSCSTSTLEKALSPLIPTTINGIKKVYESTESLTGHRLRGAIRALSVITRAPGCGDVRIAIGDDRLVARKVALLVRARAPPISEAEKRSPPYDEPLAANACLILEACVDDTVLAENLIGTTIIMDLLKLTREAKKPQTKRNASCVIARLSLASHVHREEMSRLDAMSQLTRFDSWNVDTTEREPGMLF